jgi:DNA-binding transcriptional LysR family regulator
MKTDLNLLRVLLAVYETGNVSSAATRLKMSQPAASAALARLRQSLGDPLFIRRDARMEATPRVQRIISMTRDVIEMIDHDILANPVFEPELCTDELTFCLSEIGEASFLPALFQYLRKAAPLAQIRSTSLPPKVLVQALHDGEVDSVLGYFPDLNSNDIYQQRLYSRDLVCMVRKGHPIRGRRMTLKQFINAEHVLVQDGGRSQEMFERDLANRKIERKVVLRTSHYMSIKTLIAQSDLIVVLPRTVSDLLADSEAVRFVAPPVEIQQYDLKQYWHRRFHHDPKGIWLRGVVAELFSEPHRESDRAQALV